MRRCVKFLRVKPAKVPSWSKDMKLDAYLKALEVWIEMNSDVSESVRFQDVIELLKINIETISKAEYTRGLDVLQMSVMTSVKYITK